MNHPKHQGGPSSTKRIMLLWLAAAAGYALRDVISKLQDIHCMARSTSDQQFAESVVISPPVMRQTLDTSSPRNAMIVVTLLSNVSQSWTQEHKSRDTGLFLLHETIQDIPVTLISVDRLYSSPNNDTLQNAELFNPASAFDSLIKDRTGEVIITPVLNGGRAQECPGYLTYILKNYDSLPDVSIFLHAKPFQHGSRYILEDIRYVLDNWTPEEIGFLELNDYFLCRRTDREPAWETYWQIVGFDPGLYPEYVQLQCCAQFMVTRDRILLRPRSFYEQLLKLSYESNQCAFQEHFWHVFFGEGPILPDERSLTHYRTYNKSGYATWRKPPQIALLHNPYHSMPRSKPMESWYRKYTESPSSYYETNTTTCELREGSILLSGK